MQATHTAKAVVCCLTGLNDLDACTVLSEMYSDAFGFAQEEARQMTVDRGMPEKLEDIRRWYDGYLFGGTEIYNEAEDVPRFHKWGEHPGTGGEHISRLVATRS